MSIVIILLSACLHIKAGPNIQAISIEDITDCRYIDTIEAIPVEEKGAIWQNL